MSKIIIATAHASTLKNFRGELIKEWVKLGFEVVAIGPEQGYENELASCGARYISLPFSPTGVNPANELRLIGSYIRILKEQQPDVLFTYHIKPVIYGSIAARIVKVPRIYSMITGLGYTFVGTSLKRRILRSFVSLQYKIALKKHQKVFFQNPDDMELFRKIGVKGNSVLINGSGVDIDMFMHSPPLMEPMTFLFVGRLLKDKGIYNFFEAAKMVKAKYNNVCFQVLGRIDNNPAAIKQEQLDKWVKQGTIDYLGFVDDVRPYLNKCSVFVLPSYREGVPRSALEAMATGRAIITTDAPGCRETVMDGYNGIIVPVDDSQALAKAIENMIKNPSLVADFGKKSRELAEDRYDVKKVNAVILKAMDMI